MASSISLRIVALISSSLSWFLTFFNSKYAIIFVYFVSKNEIKIGSKTSVLELFSVLVMNKKFQISNQTLYLADLLTLVVMNWLLLMKF